MGAISFITKLLYKFPRLARNLLFTALLCIALWGMGLVALQPVQQNAQQELKSNLETVMRLMHSSLTSRVDGQFAALEQVVQSSQVKSAVQRLLEKTGHDSGLVQDSLGLNLQDVILPWLARYQGQNFYLVSSVGEVLASLKKEDVGVASLMLGSSGLLEQVFSGSRTLLLPDKAQIALSNIKNKPTSNIHCMFLAVPVFSSEQTVLAALLVQMDSFRHISDVLKNAWSGSSGDSFLFNRQGVLLSPSRFENELRDIGMLESGESSVLAVRLVDPSIALDNSWPLGKKWRTLPQTTLARSALLGKSGIDLNGYRDYRGISVIGIWEWDADYNFGLAFEIDRNDAYFSYYSTRQIMIIFMTLLTLLLVGNVTFVQFRYLKEVDKNRLLAEREKRLAEAQRIANLGYWIWDVKTGEIEWTDETYRIFGCDPSSFHPRVDTVMALSPWVEEQCRYLEIMQDALISGQRSRYEMRFLRPDGCIGYYSSTIERRLNSDGEVVAVFGTAQDLTARRESEQRLKDLSERLALATKWGQIGIWEWDIGSRQMTWDDNMFLLFSVDKAQSNSPYEEWERRLHPEDLKDILAYLQQSFKGQILFDTQFRILLDDGQVRHIKVKAAVTSDESGKPLKLVGVSHDVSEAAVLRETLQKANTRLEERIRDRTRELDQSRKAALSIMQDAHQSKKKAEEALARLAESQTEFLKLSQAVKYSPVSVVLTDAEAKIEYVNPRFVECTGYREEEVIGENPRILKSDEHSAEFYRSMWDKLTSGEPWYGELLNKKKDGRFFWEKTAIAPIKNNSGEITHYVAVKEDITEKKLAEENLKNALIKAEDATRTKSEFLANMSHEIRTPMNAIIGLSHLALQTSLDSQQHDYLTKINSSANALLHIINDILDLSRIESGKLSIDREKFSLKEVMDSSSALVAIDLATKKLELLLQIDDSVPAVLVGDPLRIKQVLVNLLKNAVKFTHRGEVEISVRLQSQRGDKVVLECAVADSGIGISEEHVKNLFKPFAQADSSITREFGGSGLGLSISRQLVEMMGGTLEVESTLGKGSTFTFTLALDSRPDRRKKQALDLPVDLQGLTVLLVDGNSKVREFLEKQLLHLNVTVDSCGPEDMRSKVNESGQGSNPYGLLLMNYDHIESEGECLSEILLKESGLQKLAMIFMADANQLPQAIVQSESQSMCVALSKPVSDIELYNAIVKVMGHEEKLVTNRRKLSMQKVANRNLLEGVSILLTEDNKINQQVAKELLDRVGAVTTIASDGHEAVEKVKRQHFDLILMDIQMPVMDGLTATREIRKWEEENPPDESTPPLPIIALTAHAMAGHRQQSLAAGMNDHLTKPFVPEELYSCLFRWLVKQKNLTGSLDDAQLKQILPEQESKGFPQTEFPEALSGIDLKKGLQRVLGNRELYLDLLRELRRDFQDFPQQLTNALERDDRTTAQRLVHTLKGAAGTVGGIDLEAQAKYFESRLKSESQDLTSESKELIAELREIFSTLDNVLPEKREEDLISTEVGKPLELDELTANLAEFGQLMEINDIKSLGLWSELRGSLFDRFPEDVKKLSSALDKLLFSEALTILNKLKLKL